MFPHTADSVADDGPRNPLCAERDFDDAVSLHFGIWSGESCCNIVLRTRKLIHVISSYQGISKRR